MDTTSAMDCGAPSLTDSDLQYRVRLCLTRRGDEGLMAIEVEASEGVVTLRGTISNSDLRRLAIVTVRHVAGVIQVCDHIRGTAPTKRIPEAAAGSRQVRCSCSGPSWRLAN